MSPSPLTGCDWLGWEGDVVIGEAQRPGEEPLRGIRKAAACAEPPSNVLAPQSPHQALGQGEAPGLPSSPLPPAFPGPLQWLGSTGHSWARGFCGPGGQRPRPCALSSDVGAAQPSRAEAAAPPDPWSPGLRGGQASAWEAGPGRCSGLQGDKERPCPREVIETISLPPPGGLGTSLEPRPRLNLILRTGSQCRSPRQCPPERAGPSGLRLSQGLLASC